MGQFLLDDLFDEQIIYITEIENTCRKFTRWNCIRIAAHVKKVFNKKQQLYFILPWNFGLLVPK